MLSYTTLVVNVFPIPVHPFVDGIEPPFASAVNVYVFAVALVEIVVATPTVCVLLEVWNSFYE